MDRRSKKSDVLSGNANQEMVVKKKAPNPKADMGIAVAVPRWVGQLTAARWRSRDDRNGVGVGRTGLNGSRKRSGGPDTSQELKEA